MGTDQEVAYAPVQLDPEEAAEQLKHWLVVGVAALVDAGVPKDRISVLATDRDPFVRWVAVDGQAVFRAIVLPDVDEPSGEDVMATYGTWLPAAEELFRAAAGVETPSDEPGEPSEPDLSVN